jgi:predicted dehydrogenase
MGRMGRFHLERLCMTKLDCEFLVYWDPGFNRSINIGSNHIQPSQGWDSFVNHSDMETVLLCSPTEFHFEQLLTLIKAGKTVYVEHPVCFTLEEVDKINAFSDSEKQQLKMLPNQFNQTDYFYARQAVDEGTFGTSLYAEISSAGAKLIEFENHSSQLFEMISLYLDQFLQLLPVTPDAVFAVSTDQPADELPANQLSIMLFSKTNSIGQIQINRNSSVPSKPLWKVEGANGGYFEGKIYLRTDEEEIYSQPASKLFPDLPEENSEYAFTMNAQESSGDLKRALLVVRILNTLRDSLEKRTVIPIS